MRSSLVAACCRGLSVLTTSLFCSGFAHAGEDAYVQFPVLYKNGRNITLGAGVDIGYATRMLLNRDQRLVIGDGTIVESFVEFEPGESIDIGKNCIIARGTKVPAGANIVDGSAYGAPRAVPHRMRPTAADGAVTVLVALGILCFAASLTAIAWTLLGIALLVCADEVVAPALCGLWLLIYLGSVGWGEDRTFGADNLVFGLIMLAVLTAVRWISTTAQERPQRSTRRETNA